MNPWPVRPVLPPIEQRPPSRDLWPEILERRPPAADWSWPDAGAAAAIAILVSLFPGLLWLLLYYL